MALIRCGASGAGAVHLEDYIKSLTASGAPSGSVSIDLTDINEIKYTLTGKTGSDTNTKLTVTGDGISYQQMFYTESTGTSYTIDCSAASGVCAFSVGYSTITFDEFS